MVLSAWCIVPALGALITQQNTTNSRAQRARAGNFAVAVVICVLLLSAVATAQTWTEKRAKLPPATTATGTYTPANVVPMANTAGTQQVLFYNPVDQMVEGWFGDGGCGGCEWGNSMIEYDPSQDTGASTGVGTGWFLRWTSLIPLHNNSGGLVGAEISNLSCTNGVVTVTVASCSSNGQPVRVNDWLLPYSMPTGFSNPCGVNKLPCLDNKMFQIQSCGVANPNCTVGGSNSCGPYKNLFSTFTYNDSACTSGASVSPLSSTAIIIPDERPDTPMKGHREGIAFDTARNVVWMAAGTGDDTTDAVSINAAHSAMNDLYRFSKNVNGGANWGWTQLCGFGGPNVGLGNNGANGVPLINGSPLPNTAGPGSTCGQQFLSTTAQSDNVDGIPCSDTELATGGISTGGNTAGCGIKFPYMTYEPVNDVVMIFGGSWSSGPQCEVILFYPSVDGSTGTWKHPYNPTGCGKGTYPAARSNNGGSRLVPLGNGNVLLFGGTNSVNFSSGTTGIFNDTWEFTLCASNSMAHCGWTNYTGTNTCSSHPNYPACDPDPVLDWDPDLNKVVYVDKQSPAHYWFYDPKSHTWADQGTGTGVTLPSFTVAQACSPAGSNCFGVSGATIPYFTIGAYDQHMRQFVVMNTCSTLTYPPCSSSMAITQIWTLDLSAGNLVGVSQNPTSLSFGNQTVGTTSAAQSVTLTNSGNAAVIITAISAPTGFAETDNCPISPNSLAAGANCTINVTFTPTTTQAYSGSLVIADNVGSGTQSEPLTGSGVVTNTPVTSLTPSSLTFNSQIVGTTSAGQIVTLANGGGAPLAVSNIQLTGTNPGDYAFTTNPAINCGGSVAAGFSCAISVTFSPTAAGTRTGSITITDNASNSPQTVGLTGTGLLAVSLSPSSVAFPSRVVGTTSAATSVTLSNNQSTTVTITSVVLNGDFAQTNTCGGSVKANGKCTFSITFTPTATGTRTGSITITDNANNSPQVISLSGTGTAVQLLSIAVTPASPSLPLGETLQFTAKGTYNNGTIQNLTNSAIWSSSNSKSATVNSAGLATSLAQGTATIKAVSGTISGSTTLTVTAPALMSIVITPANPTISLTTNQQFTATGTYSNNTTQNLTSSATWASSNTAVASVASTGLATSKAQGSTTITATYGTVSGSTTLTVGPPALLSIAVTPANPSIGSGLSQQFAATGTYADGSTANITEQVSWSSSSPGSVTISNTAPTQGLAQGVAVGSSTITALMGSVRGSTILTVAPAALQSIAVTPANPSIPLGTTQQLTATGTYSDGSTQNLTGSATWNSSDTSVATIDNTGLAHSVAQGSTTISATSGNVSGSTLLTVGVSALVSIAITPANPSIALGTAQQFSATGTYSDGSTLDITDQVVWSSSSSDASISNSTGSHGLAQSVAVGSSTITAVLNSTTGSTSLTITPAALVSLAISPINPTVAQGLNQQFTAIGTFTDGSTQDLTATATWNSSSTVVATISNAPGTQGQATAVAQGSTNITATFGSVLSNTAILTVQAPILVSITVNPTTPSIALGMTQQFTATGTYSDGSTQDLSTSVVWSSSSTSIATISNAVGTQGLASGTGQGATTITATSASVSGNTVMTVTPAVIVSISVTPATATIPLGATQQFTAAGTFSDQSTQDVTATVHWAAGTGDVATISNSQPTQGLATSVAAGNVAITATSGSVTGSASLIVSPATLESIAVTPANISMAAGTSQQFTVTGTYSDNSTQDLTALVNWTTSPGGIANISNASGSQGMASAVTQGTTTVIATLGSINGSTTLTVTAATLVSIAVTPANPTITLGSTQQFTAAGTYSDGSTQDLTNSVEWNTDTAMVATVNASGLATSISAGSVTVTATLNAVTGSTTLVVAPAP